MTRRPGEVRLQLEHAKLLPHIKGGGTMSANGETLMGVAVNLPALLITLRAQKAPRGPWMEGNFYGLHRNVATTPRSLLTDFRSHTHSLGWGSLQLVIDTVEGTLYADVDAANPYEDATRFVQHTGEVISSWWRGWTPPDVSRV
jgi:hypothetical protein